MAATDSTLEVQKALVAALRGNATVTALVGQRIYDHPPDEVAFPYIAFGVAVGQPAVETRSGEGWEVLQTLQAFSRTPGGRVQVAQILAATVDAFNALDGGMNLDTKTVVMLRLVSQDIRTDPGDGITRIGTQRWQVVTDG